MAPKRVIGACLIAIMILSTCTGFTYMDGIGTMYFDSNKQIFDHAVFKEQSGWHDENGMENAYIVEVDLTKSTLEPIVFNGAVRETYTVGSMINYLEAEGYKVLAAINGDIYDTASGTPRGTVIHNEIIVTSGYDPGRVLTFDWNGQASMKWVTLAYELRGTIGFEYEEEYFEGPVERNINFFNVPFGAARGLHLFNRHYSSATRTSGNCIEVVIDCGSSDNTQLRVNDSIIGTVKSVNIGGSNTPIGENEIVLSTIEGSDSAADISALIPGSEVEISVRDQSDDGHFSNIREAMGIDELILENGIVVTTGTNVNPRTVLGIKADGSIVLYVVDGRQGHSKGLNLVDLAKHMKDLGCIHAFNFDGGGSSTMYVRFPGLDEKAAMKNSPSDASQRRVANGLILAYTSIADPQAARLNLYPAKTLVMPGADVSLTVYASNSLYEKVSTPNNVTYSVDPSKGSINSSGVFTAGYEAGLVKVEAYSGNIRGETDIEIVNDFTFKVSVEQLFIEPTEATQLNVIVMSGTAKVNSQNHLFTWSCDENIGNISDDGKFTAADMGAQQGNIYIEHGGNVVTVPVQVGAMSIDFDDTKDHWAREYIGQLAARGIVKGMGDNLFEPDSNLTRAQFLAMLANSLYGIDVKEASPTPFADVPTNEWYYHFVNWGYENGIVSGMSETIFAPDDNISREQMTVMLCNFARYLNFTIAQTSPYILFSDQNEISSWAADYVRTVVGGGIMSGQPEGDFQPQGNATRAQAARVVYVFCDLRAGLDTGINTGVDSGTDTGLDSVVDKEIDYEIDIPRL